MCDMCDVGEIEGISKEERIRFGMRESVCEREKREIDLSILAKS